MSEKIALTIPEELYRRLKQVAEVTRQPLEAVALQTISDNLPNLPPHLPTHMRQALEKLNQLNDDELWGVMTTKMDTAEQDEYSHLQYKNSIDQLSEQEVERLETLYEVANFLTLKKAYAGVLLKWRGHRLPTLAELETSTPEPE